MHSAFQAGDLEAAESQMPQPQGKAATFGLPKEGSSAEQEVGHLSTAFCAVNVSSSIRVTMEIREQEHTLRGAASASSTFLGFAIVGKLGRTSKIATHLPKQRQLMLFEM